MNQIRLYNLLRNALKMSDQDAAEFISAMGTMAESRLDVRIQTLATKNDIQDLCKSIFLYGVVQLIAIVGSVIAIVKFMR